MRLVTRGTAVWGIVALVLVVWACETTRNPGGIQRDVISPVITLSNTAGDTQAISGGLRFTVSAADNLSLKNIDLTFSGGLIGSLDTTFFSEIGRASCRGRGEISVVAVSLKKKKKLEE